MTHFSIRLPQHQARLVALADRLSPRAARLRTRPPTRCRSTSTASANLLPDRRRRSSRRREAAFELNAAPGHAALDGVLLRPQRTEDVLRLRSHGRRQPPPSLDSRTGFDDRLRTSFPQSPATPLRMQLAEDMALLRRDMPFARAREMLEEQRQAARRGRTAQEALADLETLAARARPLIREPDTLTRIRRAIQFGWLLQLGKFRQYLMR